MLTKKLGTETSTKVTDAATAAVTYYGAFQFTDGANVTTEYIYDKNGNLKKDYNKKIVDIQYNSLNLPDGLQFTNGNTVNYVYNAAGQQLSVTHRTAIAGIVIPMTNVMQPLTPANILATTSTDYCGNVIYENGTLGKILTGEGYITLSGATPTYHYFLKDHQGNNRVVINQNGTVEQVNHYYPFGGLFGESTAGGVQPYKYNGKELDRMHGLDLYDYGARHYDAALGRWFTVDPLAEKYYSISPYIYVAYNPVRFIDPDGRDVWEINNQGKIVNQIKDKNQDAFYMVDKNGNRTYTTDAEGNKHYNSISFEYGTITDSKKSGWFRSATSFAVNSESSGAELFKFFADNTKIEYGLINTQNDGSTVMTNHNETSVSASATAQKMDDKGQTVTSVVHNHPEPYGINPSGFRLKDKSGDKFAARMFVPNVERYVYQNGKLVAYDGKSVIGTMSWGLVFQPSTARKHPVYPIRQYPGVGLPPP